MLALQEIYDLVADQGWDVTKSPSGHFELTPPDRSATVLGPTSRSDHRAIEAMVADLRRAGLAPATLEAIDPASATVERPPSARSDDRRPSLADAWDERAKRRQEAGARMATTADAGNGETTIEKIARLERELDAARQEAARQETVGAAEAVAEWFRGGKDPSTEEWVAVLSAAPEDAIRAAGLLVRGGTRSLGAGTVSGGGGGTRAPRLSIDEVVAQLPSAPFTVGDLAARIDREPATARNYIPKLLEAGAIVEAGEDNSGPGRAAKLYARA